MSSSSYEELMEKAMPMAPGHSREAARRARDRKINPYGPVAQARRAAIRFHCIRKDPPVPGQIAEGNIREKLRLHIFEYVTAITWCLVGLNYLLDAKGTGLRSSIGESIHPYDIIWSLFYIVAAPSIIYGLTWNSQRFRIAGLYILSIGLVMQFLAAITTSPLEPRDFVFFFYAIACSVRAYLAIQNVKPGVRRYASNR